MKAPLPLLLFLSLFIDKTNNEDDGGLKPGESERTQSSRSRSRSRERSYQAARSRSRGSCHSLSSLQRVEEGSDESASSASSHDTKGGLDSGCLEMSWQKQPIKWQFFFKRIFGNT